LLANMSRPSSLLRMVLSSDGHVIGMERMLENLGQRFATCAWRPTARSTC
jgi:hypothetical protein